MCSTFHEEQRLPCSKCSRNTTQQLEPLPRGLSLLACEAEPWKNMWRPQKRLQSAEWWCFTSCFIEMIMIKWSLAQLSALLSLILTSLIVGYWWYSCLLLSLLLSTWGGAVQWRFVGRPDLSVLSQQLGLQHKDLLCWIRRCKGGTRLSSASIIRRSPTTLRTLMR